MRQFKLLEGLEYGDLARLIHTKLHIDEFKSKMGDDADILVLSFKVGGKEPARDLMNFIERGYDWVLDADVSSGELDDGEYLVFVESERSPRSPDQVMKMMEDLMNLTEQDLSDWKFQYRKDSREFDLTSENIRKHVPLTPQNYVSRFGQEEPPEIDIEDDKAVEPEEQKADAELTAMKEAARVPITKTAPKNDFTDRLRVFAGLK